MAGYIFTRKQENIMLVGRSQFFRDTGPRAVVPLQSQRSPQSLAELCCPSPPPGGTSAFRHAQKSSREEELLSGTMCCRGSVVFSSFISYLSRSMT